MLLIRKCVLVLRFFICKNDWYLVVSDFFFEGLYGVDFTEEKKKRKGFMILNLFKYEKINLFCF